MDKTEALALFADATNNELYDPDFCGGDWMIEAVETQESPENFIESAREWAEQSSMKSGEIAGFPFVAWAVVQPRKGEPRRPLSVIDFGECRFAIESDLTRFI